MNTDLATLKVYEQQLVNIGVVQNAGRDLLPSHECCLRSRKCTASYRQHRFLTPLLHPSVQAEAHLEAAVKKVIAVSIVRLAAAQRVCWCFQTHESNTSPLAV